MARLLFVCTGNICRSPFAERLSAHRFLEAGRDEWTFASAGVGALEGEAMEGLMRARLEARGGDGAGFVARQVDVMMLQEADLIIALQAHHRSWIVEEMPVLVRRTFTLGQAVRFVVEEAGALRGETFLDALTSHHSRARRRDDVGDPYRRGEQAADRAATEIDDLLGVLLPRLVA